MPVRRFRSVAEMKKPYWREPGDPELFEVIAALWAAGAAIVGHRFPPGVYPHRTVESLDALTEEWARANFRAFQAARTSPRTTAPDGSAVRGVAE
jgi:hypothetical protein